MSRIFSIKKNIQAKKTVGTELWKCVMCLRTGFPKGWDLVDSTGREVGTSLLRALNK